MIEEFDPAIVGHPCPICNLMIDGDNYCNCYAISKKELTEEINKSRDYHIYQANLNKEIAPIVTRHHEIIIDYIENELKDRVGLK